MAFIVPNKFGNLKEGLVKTTVCRVVELIDENGAVKGFILKSVIGEVGKKKEEKKDSLETLDSFVEGDEMI